MARRRAPALPVLLVPEQTHPLVQARSLLEYLGCAVTGAVLDRDKLSDFRAGEHMAQDDADCLGLVVGRIITDSTGREVAYIKSH